MLDGRTVKRLNGPKKSLGMLSALWLSPSFRHCADRWSTLEHGVARNCSKTPNLVFWIGLGWSAGLGLRLLFKSISSPRIFLRISLVSTASSNGL